MTDWYESRARLFRALGHPARLRILEILAVEPCCVCDIVQKMGCRQPYASQQLAILREAGLVSTTREGIMIRYRLASPDVLRMLASERAPSNDAPPPAREERT